MKTKNSPNPDIALVKQFVHEFISESNFKETPSGLMYYRIYKEDGSIGYDTEHVNGLEDLSDSIDRIYKKYPTGIVFEEEVDWLERLNNGESKDLLKQEMEDLFYNSYR